MPSITDEEILKRIRSLQVVRPRDLPDVPRQRLQDLLRKGSILRITRGLYTVPNLEATEHHDLAAVSRLVPRSTVCLLSALSYHRLTTQMPHQVWIAIGNKQHPPRVSYPPIRLIRMSGDSLVVGVRQHVIDGVHVQVFDPAKTVADCFKFRNRIGLDVALEALRDFRRKYRGQVDQLWDYAGACRVRTVLRPYLEAVE